MIIIYFKISYTSGLPKRLSKTSLNLEQLSVWLISVSILL